MPRTPSQTLFAYIVDRPDEDLELDVAALLIGEWEHENLDVAHYLGILDQLAAAATARLEGDEPLAALRALNYTLFEEQGYSGNQTNYYDPRNSFLHEVIDRRTGIPISLSVLYIEVARRMGLVVHGVGFPGHFVVRHDTDGGALILDPFRAGMVLQWEALEEILRNVAGEDAELTPALLEPASKHQILVRMLTNLAVIYGRRNDTARSIEVLERLLILEPEDQRVARELDKLRGTSAHELN